MYLYEECTYQELQTNPMIDPDSAEAIYAMAQCFKLGNKGVDKDEDNYISLLKEASELGYELAINELRSIDDDTVDENFIDKEIAGEKPDYNLMKLRELREREDKGDALACLEMYQRSSQLGDKIENRKRHLEKCVESIKGVADNKVQGEVLYDVAHEYEKLNFLDDARKCYEFASEKNNLEAREKLVEYYKKGYGGPVDYERANEIRKVLGREGTPKVRYQVAKELLNEESNSDALEILEDIVREKNVEPLLFSKVCMRKYTILPSNDGATVIADNNVDIIRNGIADAEFLELLVEISDRGYQIHPEEAYAVAMAYKGKNKAVYERYLIIATDGGHKQAAEEKHIYDKEKEEQERQEREQEEQRIIREKEEREREEQLKREILEKEEAERLAIEKDKKEKEENRKKREQEAYEGNTEAILEMGEVYRNSNRKKAIKLWEIGADKGSAECFLNLAEIAFEEERWIYSLNMAQNAIENGISGENLIKAEELVEKVNEVTAADRKRVEDIQRYIVEAEGAFRPQVGACVIAVVASIVLGLCLNLKLNTFVMVILLVPIIGMVLCQGVVAYFTILSGARYYILNQNGDDILKEQEIEPMKRFQNLIIKQCVLAGGLCFISILFAKTIAVDTLLIGVAGAFAYYFFTKNTHR